MLRTRVAALLVGFALGGCNCGHHDTLGGADAIPSAPNLEFGPVPVNQTSTLPLPLSNTGTLTLIPGKMTLGGANPGDFRVQGTFPTAGIPAGTSASINIAFQPSTAGVRTATLSIPSNSEHIPVLTVTLNGQGGDVAIGASPQPLNFGNVLVGAYSTLPLTLANQGATASSPIQIQAMTGPQASWFTQTSTPASIPPGGTLVIQVTFSPQAVGPASASLPVVLCGTCTPTNLTLVGQGVQGQLTFVPYPVSFPTVPAGSTANQIVTASNTGTYPITVGSLELQSGASPAITLSMAPSSFPFNLAPAGSQPDAGAQSFTFQVNYAPTDTNGDTATVEADWASVGGVPQPGLDPIYGNTSLNPCSLTFSPPGVNFGNASAGATLTKYLTIGNTGQESCSLTNIQLDSTSDPSFSLPSNPGTLTIPAAGTAQVQINFLLQNPGNPLARKGYLDYDSTDPNHATGQVPLTAFIQGTSPYSAGWPKYHYDNTDRGQTEADTSSLQGVVVWEYPVTPPSQATGFVLKYTTTYMNSPVVDANGNVYQATLDGQLLAIDPSGNLIWSAPINSPAQDPHPATPIIAADGTIFVESGTDAEGGHLYHFSATGQQLASDAPPNLCNPEGEGSGGSTGGSSGGGGGGGNNGCPDGFDVCPSIGNDGLLYDGDDFGATLTYSVGAGGAINQGVGTTLNYVGERVAVALDTNDNSYWCSSASCWAVSSADAGFNVLWGGQNGATIDGNGSGFFTNSDLAWDRDHTGMLMVMEATLGFGGGAQTWLVAMDPSDGSTPWQYAMPSFTTPTSPNIFTGTFVFSADFGNAAPAIADDGTVYVGNGNGLYAFSFTGTGSSTTGTVKTGFPFLSADVDSAPAIGGDGTVFFGCSDGTFYAVNPDGSLRFKIVTSGRISSAPAIGPDGTVFFVSDEGNLYAIR